jgi:hypothetical protein
MPLITLLCLCYAQHVSGTIMPIIRSSRRLRWLQHMPSGSRVASGWKLRHLNSQPAATREPDGLCGSQHKHNEVISGI